MKDRIKALIQEQIKKTYTPEYQPKATDEEALGVMLSQYLEWDGLAILKTAYAALEDANFHTENETILKMIETLEAES